MRLFRKVVLDSNYIIVAYNNDVESMIFFISLWR